MKAALETAFQRHLFAGESLKWVGRAELELFMPADLLLIPFSLVWAGAVVVGVFQLVVLEVFRGNIIAFVGLIPLSPWKRSLSPAPRLVPLLSRPLL